MTNFPYNDTDREVVMLTTHGSLMSVNWSFCTVFGVIIARYFRHKPWWASVHKLLQGIASFSTFPVFIIALVSGVHEGLTTIHADIGITVVILGTIQGILGTMMWGSVSLPFCSKIGVKLFCLPKSLRAGGNGRKVLVRIHGILGKVLVIEAAVVIFLGTLILPTAVYVRYMYLTWVSIVVITVVLLETRLQLARRVHRKEEQKRRQDLFRTPDEERGAPGQSQRTDRRPTEVLENDDFSLATLDSGTEKEYSITPGVHASISSPNWGEGGTDKPNRPSSAALPSKQPEVVRQERTLSAKSSEKWGKSSLRLMSSVLPLAQEFAFDDFGSYNFERTSRSQSTVAHPTSPESTRSLPASGPSVSAKESGRSRGAEKREPLLLSDEKESVV